jgi:hypothetical protein
MIEIIKNYGRTKISLVLRFVLENFEAEDEHVLNMEMIKKISDTKENLLEELLANSELMEIKSITEINEALEEVKYEFINEILN